MRRDYHWNGSFRSVRVKRNKSFRSNQELRRDD
jgi:hypothetical protein